MKTPFPRRGSALIIVLAFIVMISIVMLTYLATTQSSMKKSSASAAMAETDLLAEAATASIIDDLRQEMLAGADTVGADNVMTVTQPWAMVPSRVLKSGIGMSDTNFLNLVKQSASNQKFYPGDSPAIYSQKSGAGEQGLSRASAVNTSQPSLNGRVLSALRWNKPMLLTGSGFSSDTQLPDWILISRKGPDTNGAVAISGASSDKGNANDYVIGRYAYNIYDIGGLLDINVAGFPSAFSTNSVYKGSAAWADLSALPGVTSVDLVAGWRNTNSVQRYRDMVEGRPLGVSTVTTNSPWGESGGFQKPYSTNGVSDNHFFSRQDLIRYAMSFSQSGLNTNALPFLTTFSADLDQPSFSPDRDRPKVLRAASAGGNDAYQRDDEINPEFLQITGPNGDPMVKRRFPLDRLKYVVPNSNDPLFQENVRKYFGLIWDGADRSWIYQPSDEGSPASKIKRLSEVSGRDPNFLELLQAAISVGSLGNQYQVSDEPAIVSPRLLGGRDSSVGYHILQVAANIIDQYDGDSFPTIISLNGLKAYGIEDLPYLFHVRTLCYKQELVVESELKSNNATPIKLPTGGAPYRSVMLSQPAVWNPHAPSGSDGPMNFRIVARGSARPFASTAWWTSAQWPERTWVANYPSTNPKDTNPSVMFNPGDDYITFSRTASGPASFREPFPLGYPDYPAGSGAAPSGQGWTREETVLAGSQMDLPGTRAFGFRIGYVWAGPGNTASQYFIDGMTEGAISYELQYQVDGTYVTYDVMEAVPPFPLNIFNIEVPSVSASYAPKPRSWTRLDPRSDRMGFRNMVYFPAVSSVGTQWLNGETFRPDSARGAVALGNLPAGITLADYRWTSSITPTGSTTYWGLSSANNSTAVGGVVLYYADPDGVVRKAMGGYASGTSGLPMARVSGNDYSSRPVVLNRAFRSVAELGYAFRGTPWKQIDFWTPESGDTALLDLFCLYEAADPENTPIVAGRVNLNSRRPEVLQSLIQGAALQANLDAPPTIASTAARNIANSLVAWTTNKTATAGPLRNRAELVGKFVSGTSFSGFSTNFVSHLSSSDTPYSFRRESVLRALVDSGTTRTWTFLIDLIVQKGRYPSSASGLDKFSVEGEQRFWVQVAIDRYTGKIVARKVESVNE